MNQFPFLSTARCLQILRFSICLLMVAHGLMRMYAGTVGNFGDFLSTKGFPAGEIVAWSITLFEIIGGFILAFGYYRKIISSLFILELLAGIMLVHFPNGWFVVGHTSGGVEYSVLLIICFLLIASTANKE